MWNWDLKNFKLNLGKDEEIITLCIDLVSQDFLDDYKEKLKIVDEMNGIFNRDYDEDTINVELIDIMTYYLAKPWLNEDEDFLMEVLIEYLTLEKNLEGFVKECFFEASEIIKSNHCGCVNRVAKYYFYKEN